MKAILYLDEGSKFVAEFLTPPRPKERETWGEMENRLVKEFNASQPLMVHKVVRMKIMRN